MGAGAQAREVAGTVAKQCSRTGLKLQTREVLDATAGRDVASFFPVGARLMSVQP